MTETTPFSTLIEALTSRYWGMEQHLFAPALLASLREEALGHFVGKRTHAAGIGKESQMQGVIRETHIKWFDPLALSPTEAALWVTLEALRETLNRECFLSLVDFECHFAIYPIGAYYRRHLDQFHAQTTRLISFVLYLDADWLVSDGGALRLFLHDGTLESHTDILPEMGNFAMFRSADLEHEVMVTQRERVCVVGWMKTRANFA